MNLRTLFAIGIGLASVVGVKASSYTYADADYWVGGQIITAKGSSDDTFQSSFNIKKDNDGTSSFTVGGGYSIFQNAGTTYTSVPGFDPKTEWIASGDVSFWFSNATGDKFRVKFSDFTETIKSSGEFYFMSESLNVSMIADLQADGILKYTVKNLGTSDLELDYALLTVKVPDTASSMILLGSALSGFAMLRRKLS